MKKTIVFLLPVFFLAGAGKINAQFSGSNITEFQLGNIPDVEPKDPATIYDQLNLNYRWKTFKASVRVENFYSTVDERDQYTEFSQYSLNFRKKGFEAKVGNFYETLGRGLLYRGFEIKNSILEDQIYRVRQVFFRDTRGIYGGYSNKNITFKILHGKSLTNELPPTDPNNRVDLVTASELNVRVGRQRIGAIFLDNDNPADHAQYVSTYLEGTLIKNVDYYGEYAHKVNAGQEFFSWNEEDSYGGFFWLNYSTNGFGASFELKDYHNLFIGSGISDPPTLVKEHSYKLLNRSTHVTNLFDERGYQLEVFIKPSEKHLITLNTSRAVNTFGETSFIFNEYFVDWHIELDNLNHIKIYGDYSSDNLMLEKNRFAAGVYFTHNLQKNWSATIETEFQQIDRYFTEDKIYNSYVALVVNKSTRFSASLIWEYTSDPNETDLQSTEEIEKSRNYLGVGLSYKPNNKNTLSLFAGNRRGGPACTSGICYEVLDFKGVELRWAIRL